MDTAIAMLDRDGAQRLTLRSLAAELDSGVASLYWYASGKDELMAMVADEVLGRALREFHALWEDARSAPEQFADFSAPAPDERTSTATAAALADLRCFSLCLFSQMLTHRWLAAQLVNAGPDEENALRTWECTGQILQRMELSTSQQFHASMAVTNYASGMGAEISQRQAQRNEQDAEQMFREQLERWDHASTQDFPFVHSVLGEFRRMASPGGSDRDPAQPDLTERETEVLKMVAKGLSYKQIAERLVLSHRTVQNHVQNTLRKLQMHNRVELTRYAIEQGLDDEL